MISLRRNSGPGPIHSRPPRHQAGEGELPVLQYRVAAADGKVHRLFDLDHASAALLWAQKKARLYGTACVVEVGFYDGAWRQEALEWIVGPEGLTTDERKTA